MSRGSVFWVFGPSGAGKTTLCAGAAERLRREGRAVVTLDADEIRSGLNSDLGFTVEARRENIRRIAEVAAHLSRQSFTVLVSAITPMEEFRRSARSVVGESLGLVYLRCPIPVCEQRDPKGLYRAARDGKVAHMTGVASPFEEPEDADFVIDTSLENPPASGERLWRFVAERLP